MKLGLRLTAAALVAFAAACSSTEDFGSSAEQVTVCGQTTVKGIDVYHGDNGGAAINWTKVKAAGISFAFAKATESTNFTDSMFATNWAGMKSAGIVRGAYHFFHADVDPTQQATFFLSTVGTVEPGDMLALDLESTNNQSQATILANAETFMSAVKSKTGITPILYMSPAFLSSFGTLGQYPLWVANYGVSCPTVPSAWKSYTFWQSTGTGSLSALSGAVDLDTFNGSLSDLTAFAGGTSSGSDAGGPVDAGTTKEAGPAQDAGATVDAEAPTTNDASQPQPADDGGANPGDWPSSDGCDAAPSRGSNGDAWLAVLGLALLARRRRYISTQTPAPQR
ncbi:MAG TPA: GH25 family lysozyme [Polyangiaceae bacterium]|jgi:lysozyme